MSKISRRVFLRRVNSATLLATVASIGITCKAEDKETGETSEMESETPAKNPLLGIDTKAVVQAYKDRELENFSDKQLFAYASEIVSVPTVSWVSSFVGHAPLELLARQTLLGLLPSEHKEMARKRIVKCAALYESAVPYVSDKAKKEDLKKYDSLDKARKHLAGRIEEQDEEGTLKAVKEIGVQYGSDKILETLAPLALQDLSSYSHAHIGVWLVDQHSPKDDALKLLSSPLTKIASKSDHHIKTPRKLAKTTEGELDKSVDKVESEFRAILLKKVPKLEQRGGSLAAMMKSVDRSSVLQDYFGELMKYSLNDEQVEAGFRAVNRICASTMLVRPTSNAKFGWSHCLTFPHAAWRLSKIIKDRKFALACALLFATAYRGMHEVDTVSNYSWTPKTSELELSKALKSDPQVAASCAHRDAKDDPEAVKKTLAIEALRRHDAHNVKYLATCADLCELDPKGTPTYLAAAAILGSVWVKEFPKADSDL